jgi:mannose-1-phosphate guanylyltransferase
MYAAILAGGSGTRFWPLSRKARPKQMLRLLGGAPMLRETMLRLAPAVAPERCLVVCGARHAREVAKILPELPPGRVLAEPTPKNTAAAVALAAIRIGHHDPRALVAILPADHHVGNPAGFRAALSAASKPAKEGYLVTLGITPSRPETGYGYIAAGDALAMADGHEVRAVSAFVEKPDRARAEAYVADGSHLWNAGIFVFRADVMRGELARHLPGVSDPLEAAAARLDDPAALAEAWSKVDAISIDHGVMERTNRAAVLPVDFGWSDVGSFASLPEVLEADESGNVLVGDAKALDAAGNVVHAASGRPVVVLGARDLVVVDAGDAVLVCPKDRCQDIRRVVEALEAEGRDDLL